MSRWPAFLQPGDLAPGDATPHPGLPEGLELHGVTSSGDPLFETAYALLDEEFGAKGEMETREVIESRLAWDPTKPVNGCGLKYDLMLLMVGNECVGLRDHTAIYKPGASDVVVHLSHVLVIPKWRRKGLAAILRTLPVITARNCAKAVGKPDLPVTLFCEMEPIDLSIPANKIRRTSYESAGFLAIGAGLGYMQPDFRPPSAIDADLFGSKPILFDILYRRVGREGAHTISGADVLASVESIYAMYSAGFRAKDMAPCLRWLDGFRAHARAEYTLYPPTAVP